MKRILLFVIEYNKLSDNNELTNADILYMNYVYEMITLFISSIRCLFVDCLQHDCYVH